MGVLVRNSSEQEIEVVLSYTRGCPGVGDGRVLAPRGKVLSQAALAAGELKVLPCEDGAWLDLTVEADGAVVARRIAVYGGDTLRAGSQWVVQHAGAWHIKPDAIFALYSHGRLNTVKILRAEVLDGRMLSFSPLLVTIDEKIQKNVNQAIRNELQQLSTAKVWQDPFELEDEMREKFLRTADGGIHSLAQDLRGEGLEHVLGEHDDLASRLEALWDLFVLKYQVVEQVRASKAKEPYSAGRAAADVFSLGISAVARAFQPIVVYDVHEPSVAILQGMVGVLLLAPFMGVIEATARECSAMPLPTDSIQAGVQTLRGSVHAFIPPPPPTLYTTTAGGCLPLWGMLTVCVDVDANELKAHVTVQLLGTRVADMWITPSNPLNIDANVGVVRLIARVEIRGRDVWGLFEVQSLFGGHKWEGVIVSVPGLAGTADANGVVSPSSSTGGAGPGLIVVPANIGSGCIQVQNLTQEQLSVSLWMAGALLITSADVAAGQACQMRCPPGMQYVLRASTAAHSWRAASDLTEPGSKWQAQGVDGGGILFIQEVDATDLAVALAKVSPLPGRQWRDEFTEFVDRWDLGSLAGHQRQYIKWRPGRQYNRISVEWRVDGQDSGPFERNGKKYVSLAVQCNAFTSVFASVLVQLNKEFGAGAFKQAFKDSQREGRVKELPSA